MNATLSIKNYRCKGIIGVYESERNIEQELCISLHCQVDIRKAAETDAVEYAVDYDAMTTFIRQQVKQYSFQLIETLALRLLSDIKEKFSLGTMTLTVEKPEALSSADTVGVTVSA